MASSFKARSMREVLLRAATLPAVPIIVALVGVVVFAANLLWSEVTKDQRNAAIQLARQGSLYFSETQTALNALAKGIEGMDADRMDTVLDHFIAAYPRFNSLLILDGSGRAIAGAGEGNWVVGLDYSSSETYRVVTRDRSMYLSDPLISLATGEMVVNVAGPLAFEDGSAGVLTGELNLNILGVILESLHSDIHPETDFIVDGQGRLVVHHNQQWVQEQRNMADLAPVRRALKEGTVSDFYSDPQTGLWMEASAVQMSNGWVVVLTTPVLVEVRPILLLLLTFLLAVLVGFALLIPVRTHFTTQITEPVAALVRQAELLASSAGVNGGDQPLSAQGKGEFSELISLARGYNFLTAAVKDKVAALTDANRQLGAEIVERQRVERDLRESHRRLQSVIDQAHDGMAIVSEQGAMIAWNAAMEKICGVSAQSALGKSMVDLQVCFAPQDDDRDMPQEAWDAVSRQALNTGEADFLNKMIERRLVHPDGAVIITQWFYTSVPTQTGWLLVATVQDITQMRLDAERLRSTVAEKEVLLREIHHRVKNNMQVMIGLLDLQASAIDDTRVQGLFVESQNRIRSMAMVHEELYRTESYSKIDFSRYVSKLAWDVAAGMSLRPNVELVLDLEPVDFRIETAVPSGLIVNELLTNAFKHAFPDSHGGMVTVHLSRDHEHALLCVEDNGVGLQTGVDWQASRTLGLELVRILSRQLGAELTVRGEGGTCFSLRFIP
jgi:PAS domain S-box-containing protein